MPVRSDKEDVLDWDQLSAAAAVDHCRCCATAVDDDEVSPEPLSMPAKHAKAQQKLLKELQRGALSRGAAHREQLLQSLVDSL